MSVMRCRPSPWLLVVVAFAACGGADEVLVDAPGPDAAATDATTDPVCTTSGTASVSLDLGTGAEPLAFSGAWWNTGHVTKACFEISVLLSTSAAFPQPYYGQEGVLEVWFGDAPALGTNNVQLHLHNPDTYLGGTVTLTTLTDTEVAGSIDATMGGTSASGSFSAVRCQAIFDPCI
jgi:hypothetical protein